MLIPTRLFHGGDAGSGLLASPLTPFLEGFRMAQGEFTKEECEEMVRVLTEIMKGMSKKKSLDYLDHFNDLFLFLASAKKAAPNETG